MKYYIAKSLLRLIAALPFPVLFALSTFFSFFLYRVLSYRKKLVISNISHAFPEKSPEEVNAIAKKFYRNFCDMIVETIKLFHADYDDIKDRFPVNLDCYHEVYRSGRSAFMASSHLFNWEWGNWMLANQTQFQILGIYTRIKSNWLERMMLEMREKYGTKMVPTGEVRKYAERYKDVQTLEVYVTDQNPSNLGKSYWTMFMNRPVPFHTGLERAARKVNAPIIFERAVRVGRGRYKNESFIAFENPKDTEPGEITRAIVKYLEESIRNQPENYVWTHNRWKHTAKAATYFKHNQSPQSDV